MIKFNQDYKEKTDFNDTIIYKFDNDNSVTVMYDYNGRVNLIRDTHQDEELSIAYMVGYIITTRSNSENNNIRKTFDKIEQVKEYALKIFKYEDISLTR